MRFGTNRKTLVVIVEEKRRIFFSPVEDFHWKLCATVTEFADV